jgi:precorrin isomerase
MLPHFNLRLAILQYISLHTHLYNGRFYESDTFCEALKRRKYIQSNAHFLKPGVAKQALQTTTKVTIYISKTSVATVVTVIYPCT